MNKDTQIELITKLDEKNLALLRSKGDDYANADVLSNFKRVSASAKALNIDTTTPEGYAMFMVILKIDRINNLLREGKQPNNESLDDSFMDAIGYVKLAYLCYKDSE